MNQSDIARNIKDVNQWVRALYMLLFAVVLYVIGMVLMVLVIVQALFAVLTGKPNSNLLALGGSLSVYIRQAVEYLTYNAEEKPFPFADWPKAPEPPAATTAVAGETTTATPEATPSDKPEKAEEAEEAGKPAAQ